MTLLHRTTRMLSLTEIGREFFAGAEESGTLLLAAAERAVQSQHTPRGTLRITAPADIDTLVLAQAIAEYRRELPEVTVETLLTNRYVDLVTEGYDLAIRGGPLADNGLRAKRLGSGHLILVASPDYLRQHKSPKHPGIWPSIAAFAFCAAVPRTATPPGGCAVGADAAGAAWLCGGRRLDDHGADLARVGEGIALVPDSFTRDRLQARELVRVLPDWATAESPIHLVYPAQRQALPKVRAMIPIVEKHFICLITR